MSCASHYKDSASASIFRLQKGDHVFLVGLKKFRKGLVNAFGVVLTLWRHRFPTTCLQGSTTGFSAEPKSVQYSKRQRGHLWWRFGRSDRSTVGKLGAMAAGVVRGMMDRGKENARCCEGWTMNEIQEDDRGCQVFGWEGENRLASSKD